MADAINGGSGNPSTGDMSELLRTTPFAPLFDIPNVDEQVIIEGFGNAFGNGGLENPFPVGSGSVDPSELPYNGNPFAGDNFWNIFAGGQNPTQVGGSGDPLTGGGNPFAGGENPFAGGENPFAGGENPFAGGGNPFAGGSGGGNPFAGGSGGGNPFAGGSGGENPFAGGSGGGNPFA
ncbi:hypothetical protein I8751_15465 [Nostocaceae cyanobacterium CENA357]|uniref:Uncharacterized protein n=1 Tax=Atlanticothrix silvestris CENA357 TaxID=1725252 RepID=A0A8J7HEV5_9CYAN|nr:hypothetical protein [Atlanticothrix silvestris]MBH8553741.1 hypothetical protein [Atlanticothrix silvestris CENA357]